MNIKPLFDKVVLKPAKKQETSKSGIILSSQAQETPDFLEVVAVGEGKIIDGALVPVSVKVGDKVLMAKYTGTQVKLENDEYTIVSQDDILAVIED